MSSAKTQSKTLTVVNETTAMVMGQLHDALNRGPEHQRNGQYAEAALRGCPGRLCQGNCGQAHRMGLWW